MKIVNQAVNFNADAKLLEFIDKKIGKLDQYFDNIIMADIFLKVENTSDKENKIVEIKLEIPGNDLIAKKKAKTFEEAVDEVSDSLKRQLKKKKEKMRSH
jgi:putative sigma-54 modulation protein